jgi:hypothetical protein
MKFLVFFLYASALFADKGTVFCEITGELGVLSNRLGAQTIDVEIPGAAKNLAVTKTAETYEKLSNLCSLQMEASDHTDLSLKPALTVEVSGKKLPLGSPAIEAQYEQMVKSVYPTIERNSENVLVVFFHGTGSNPLDRDHAAYPDYEEDQSSTRGGGELLSWLQSAMVDVGAQRNLDFLAIHGVGSGNRQITNLHENFTAADSYGGARSTAIGSGTAENILHGLMHLKGETKNPALKEEMLEIGPKLRAVGKVIIVGWSRGGVTGIQFARDMYKDPELKDIEVHMLSIDPVPGFGNMTLGLWKNIFHIYPNVKQFTGIYAKNERSVGFTPVIPHRVDEAGTRLSDDLLNKIVMEIPGNHASLVGNVFRSKHTQTDTHPAIIASARIVRGFAQAYIYQNGGLLDGIQYKLGRYVLRSVAAGLMVKDFQKILKHMDVFQQFETESYTGVTQRLGSARKYHEDAELTGFTVIDAAARLALPRSQSHHIKGFLYYENFEDQNYSKKQVWVCHFHRWLEGLEKSGKLYVLHDESGFTPANYYVNLREMFPL